ncbi:MAG: hypothetical protein Q4D91_13910 [Lautropia sp.]|nr:hypothetical protein [Lautropia sp.]
MAKDRRQAWEVHLDAPELGTKARVGTLQHIKKAHVMAVGNTRLSTPSGQGWEAWFDAEGVSEDFMNERDQPQDQA